MSLLSFLLGEKKKTASVARERLQIILATNAAARARAVPTTCRHCSASWSR